MFEFKGRFGKEEAGAGDAGMEDEEVRYGEAQEQSGEAVVQQGSEGGAQDEAGGAVPFYGFEASWDPAVSDGDAGGADAGNAADDAGIAGGWDTEDGANDAGDASGASDGAGDDDADDGDGDEPHLVNGYEIPDAIWHKRGHFAWAMTSNDPDAERRIYRAGSDGKISINALVDTTPEHTGPKQVKPKRNRRAVVYLVDAETGEVAATEEGAYKEKPVKATRKVKTAEVPESYNEDEEAIAITNVATTFDDPALADRSFYVVVDFKRTWGAILIPWILLALLALILALFLISWRDPNSRPGFFKGDPFPDNTQVDSNSMAISTAPDIFLKEGTTRAYVKLENYEFNHCDLQASIYLRKEDGSAGELLYKSGAIPTGSWIEYADFNRPLDPGHYELLVVFQGYNPNPSIISTEGEFLGHEKWGAAVNAVIDLWVYDANTGVVPGYGAVAVDLEK
jgi:hypothetical protein